MSISDESIKKISEFLEGISVEDKYVVTIPFHKGNGIAIFTENDLMEFSNPELTNFEANIKLKAFLSQKIKVALESNDTTTLKNIFDWIVYEWGGIRSQKRDNDLLYQMAMNAITNSEFKFKRIASISKILSFYEPENFVIYDSRVAYSLNAIIFFGDASDKYFPIPPGTNSKINAFNIEVLIRLKYKPKEYKFIDQRNIISNGDKNLFFKKENEAYCVLNQLIKEVNRHLYAADPLKIDKPFYTEMLLFSIADNLVYNAILKKVKIKIK